MATKTKKPQITAPVPSPLAEAGFDKVLFRRVEVMPQENPFGRETSRALPNFLEAVPDDTDRSIGIEKINFRHVVQTSTTLSLGLGHHAIACDTTSNAITITLPPAKDMLGKEYVIYFAVDGGSNLTVNTPTGETFRGAAGAGNDSALFEDAHDFLHVKAMYEGVWLVLSEVGGTYS